MSGIDKIDSELITRLNEIDYQSSLKAWSDLDDVQPISLSVLDINW